jgi:hypothetical protein
MGILADKLHKVTSITVKELKEALEKFMNVTQADL